MEEVYWHGETVGFIWGQAHLASALARPLAHASPGAAQLQCRAGAPSSVR